MIFIDSAYFYDFLEVVFEILLVLLDVLNVGFNIGN